MKPAKQRTTSRWDWTVSGAARAVIKALLGSIEPILTRLRCRVKQFQPTQHFALANSPFFEIMDTQAHNPPCLTLPQGGVSLR